MVMNKLWKTSKRKRTLIETAFLCNPKRIPSFNGKKFVKQRVLSGTLPHMLPGITPHFWWKNTVFSSGFM